MRPGIRDRQVAENRIFNFNPRQGFAWDFFCAYPQVPGINKKVPDIRQEAGLDDGTVNRKNGEKYAEATTDIFRKRIVLCYLQRGLQPAHI